MEDVVDLTDSQPELETHQAHQLADRDADAAEEVIDLVASQDDFVAAAAPKADRKRAAWIDLTAGGAADGSGSDGHQENEEPRPAKRRRAAQQAAEVATAQHRQRRQGGVQGRGDRVDWLQHKEENEEDWADWEQPWRDEIEHAQQERLLLPERQQRKQQQQSEQQRQQQQQEPPRQEPRQEQRQERQDAQQADPGGAAEAPQAPRNCSVCWDDEAGVGGEAFMHSLGACNHPICLPCLREYVSGKVTDRTFPVPCPLPDCKQPISAAECGLVLTGEEAATLGKMEAEAALGEGVRMFCPNPACSQLLLADQKHADTEQECPYCKQEICANCGVAWHKGLTCQQYQAQPGALRSKEDQAMLDLAEKEGMRRCPACGAMVERTQGCSYMTCRCGQSFCYGCGQRKAKGSNHYCTCRPQHEQWLRPPPAVAAQLQGHAAAAAAAQAAAEARVRAVEARVREVVQQRVQARAARRAQAAQQQQQQVGAEGQAAAAAAALLATGAGQARRAPRRGAAAGAAAAAPAAGPPVPPPLFPGGPAWLPAFPFLPDLGGALNQMLGLNPPQQPAGARGRN